MSLTTSHALARRRVIGRHRLTRDRRDWRRAELVTVAFVAAYLVLALAGHS